MTPVITKSFASRWIWPGATWKVYLNASDPDGDMKMIISTIDQPGMGTYPATLTRLPEDQQRELSGYLYLTTAGVRGSDFGNLTLAVQIQDRAGNLSQALSFPLNFNPRAEQENPPPGIFREQDLGPIMVSLWTVSGGS